jgi:NADH dehydrogenase
MINRERFAGCPTIAVTGATGYIGSALARRLVDSGATVRALARAPLLMPGVESASYDLRLPLPDGALESVDGVVHLAAQTDPGSPVDEAVEELAMRRLLQAIEKKRVRFVFVSSQTARPDAPTAYGRAKWRCEQLALAAGGVVVRPGQVYGGAERGLFGALCALVRALPVLPLFRPDPPIQPIHVDDLAEALARCVSRGDVRSGVYQLGEPQPIGFSVFLKTLSEERLRRSAFGVAVPLALILGLLDLPLARRRLLAQRERLRSLTCLRPMCTEDSLDFLGLRLRPLREGLTRSGFGARRHLIGEASTLLRYILNGAPPSHSSLKRYVRAVEETLGGRAISVRPSFRRAPFLLALMDQPSGRRRLPGLDFWMRIDLASLVAESSPKDASRFISFSRRGRLEHVVELALRVGVEGACRAADLVLGRLFDRLRPKIDTATS